MGSAAFNSVMNFKSLGVQFNTDLGAARKAVTSSSALLGAGRTAGTELVMSGIMNTNSILYTDDTLDNIAHLAVGIGGGDRTSVGEGTSGVVRVDRGGRRG